MSHMVIYRGVDGKPGYHQTDDIHDAVGFVEQMRNEEGVEHARIFRLEEVVFEYRPYYRVELTPGAGGASAIADGTNGTAELQEGGPVESDAEAVDVEGEAVETSVDAEVEGEVVQNGEKADAGAGKKGLFGR